MKITNEGRSATNRPSFVVLESENFVKKSFAAAQHILICRFKIAGVPRIIDIGIGISKLQQLMHLVFGIAANDAHDVADIPSVHADEIVVVVVVRARQLRGVMRENGNALLPAFAHGAVVRRIADFLAAGRGRIDDEQMIDMAALDEVRKDELRHGAAADVAVANKQDSNHLF